MAVTALRATSPSVRVAHPLTAIVLATCAAILCFSIVAILGWLALTGIPNSLRVLNPSYPGSVLAPVAATIYVTALALPPTIVVGVFAAIAATEVRLFGVAAAGMRSALALLGSLPTIVVAFAAVIGVNALGWHPSLTGAAFLLAAINMPLMTGLAVDALSRRSMDVREAASALGASPMFIVRRALLPNSGARLGSAIIIVATQLIGAAAAIAIVAGALVPRSSGAAPVGAWPLAVHVWVRGGDIGGYGATAAAALFLGLMIWFLQGVAQLRGSPDARRREVR
jgi:ABC-type phosphate transport system permease subunit